MNPISILQAANLAMGLIDMATATMQKAQSIGAIVQKAQAQGRTTLTDTEWASIQSIDDQAKQRLEQAISNAPGS